jgi:hypothetical protein
MISPDSELLSASVKEIRATSVCSQQTRGVWGAVQYTICNFFYNLQTPENLAFPKTLSDILI